LKQLEKPAEVVQHVIEEEEKEVKQENFENSLDLGLDFGLTQCSEDYNESNSVCVESNYAIQPATQPVSNFLAASDFLPADGVVTGFPVSDGAGVDFRSEFELYCISWF